jgi:hypothetical protein
MAVAMMAEHRFHDALDWAQRTRLTTLRALDRVVLGTFAVGNAPFGAAFDGANIWLAIVNGNTVSKL